MLLKQEDRTKFIPHVLSTSAAVHHVTTIEVKKQTLNCGQRQISIVLKDEHNNEHEIVAYASDAQDGGLPALLIEE